MFVFRLTESNPERVNIDYSVCCSNKTGPLQKKRQSDEYPFNIEDANIYTKPAKKKHIANNFHKVAQSNGAQDNWSEQQEEDEVVCTPDLLSLMQEEEESPIKQPEEPVQPPTPLIRVKVFANEKEMQQTHYISPHAQQLQQPPQMSMNYQLAGPIRHIQQMNLNLMSSRPPPLLVPSRHNLQPRFAIRQIVPMNQPVRLIHGGPRPLKQEWFDKAAQQAAGINGKLTTKLVELSQEQRAAITVEQMANIHNKLQELLSTSVNSLIQVRKNLRADFLSDLNNMKFPNGTATRGPNEIIYVNNAAPQFHPPPTLPPRLIYPSTANVSILQSSLEQPKARLKVRSIDELANVPSECITIPDEPEPENSVTTNGTPKLPSPEISKPSEELPLDCDKHTEFLIKQALIESKFEYTVAENMKIRVNDVPEEEVKKMLAVRVCLETNFSSGTPYTNPKKHYSAMNITDAKNLNDDASHKSSNDRFGKCSDKSKSPKNLLNIESDNSNDSGHVECPITDNKKPEKQQSEEVTEFIADQVTTDSGIELDGK